jgi:hypothetical protein
VGNEETSLITQIKLMRSDTNDRLDALKAAQLQALQELSKMGSQALVEALRDVIKDFNAKITGRGSTYPRGDTVQTTGTSSRLQI